MRFRPPSVASLFSLVRWSSLTRNREAPPRAWDAQRRSAPSASPPSASSLASGTSPPSASIGNTRPSAFPPARSSPCALPSSPRCPSFSPPSARIPRRRSRPCTTPSSPAAKRSGTSRYGGPSTSPSAACDRRGLSPLPIEGSALGSRGAGVGQRETD